jgi:hypothetical protein
MKKFDALMFALYLVVLAEGVVMMNNGQFVFGLIQVILISVFGPLRAYLRWKRSIQQ